MSGLSASAVFACGDIPVDLDQVDAGLDAEVGEGQDAVVVAVDDPYDAVLGIHVEGDVAEPATSSPNSRATRSIVLT